MTDINTPHSDGPAMTEINTPKEFTNIWNSFDVFIL